MGGWLRAFVDEIAAAPPTQQLDKATKVIGAVSLAGGLLAGGYHFFFSESNSGGSEKYALQAVIKDPDGFTYVRSMPDRDGQIVATVKDGEIFFTYVQDRNWWHVRTKDNRYGFMHSTRIQPCRPTTCR
jgi:hypothetical protein